jgi:catechol 2,3-dioxygenase-like lactoylglutathione lyase family enzyme
MPDVTGILESSLYVKDLERSRRFYQWLFGFRLLLSDERMCAFDVAGRQVLLIFLQGGSNQPNPVPGGMAPAHDGAGQLHLTFSIAADQLDAWRNRLGGEHVAIESTVHSPRGGTSLYFRDPDGHLIELATPGLWEIY